MLNDAETRWTEILCDTDELVVSLFRRGAGVDGPELHVHRTHADAFYVLEGALVVPLGPEAEPEQVPAGSLALAPPLVAHAFRMDAGDVVLLNAHAPGAGFAAYMRGDGVEFDQEPPPPGGGRPRSDAVLGRGTLVVDEAGLRVARLADEPQLGVSVVTLAAGTEAPPLGDGLTGLYVLVGAIAVAMPDEELVAGSGAWVTVRAGARCTLSASGDGETQYVAFSVRAASR